mgnify:CR=1 FL=1
MTNLIIIKIKFARRYLTNPKLLVSVKAVQDNTPSYIIKNQAKLDFLLGNNWQYFYTDLGLNEEGDVLVNYRRGSGRLYAKIVPKNAEKPEEGANWREMYKFPTTVEESLEFFGYIKKILIKKENTSICKEGCYLLLSLTTSILSDKYFDFREHPFTIIVKTKSSEKVQDIPIINLSLNEYIIGNLYTHEDQNIYEYYSTIFTHDSHKVTIDFQSNEVNLYIKVGANNKPSINDYDFYFERKDQDDLYEITKEDFIKKCNERGIQIPYDNSLLGLSMTIGLYTNKTDSLLYTTVYSMKVHLPFDEVFNIYEVKSDQKTLCKTELIEGAYRCLFMIFYLGNDPINKLIIYPQIQDHSSYDMFANFIYQENYEFFDKTYLRLNIPNEEATFSTKRTGLEYIHTDHPKEYDTFLYVNVQTKTQTIVELLSSFYTNDTQLSPNPSSPQLFAIRNDHFLFEFTTDEDLMINIQSICGDGTIYWEVDNSVQYALHGKETKISLTSSLIDKSDPEKVFSKLYIKNNNQLLTSNCPGFAFYINYLLRPSKINLDEIQFGKSTQIAYRNTDLPVYLYSKLNQTEDTNIFVSLYELAGESYSQFTKLLPFEINACIVNESKIMEYIVNPEKIDEIEFNFNGHYDPMIKTGHIFITKEQLDNMEIKFEYKQLSIYLIKAEELPDMDSIVKKKNKDRQCDPFIEFHYFGLKVESKTTSNINDVAIWNQVINLPVQVPIVSQKIVLLIKDYDGIGRNDNIGSYEINVNDVIGPNNKYENYRYIDIYGSSKNKHDKINNLMNSNAEIGSSWNGRILMRIDCKNTDTPIMSVVDLKDANEMNLANSITRKILWTVHVKLYCAYYLPKEYKKYSIRIIMQNYSMFFQEKKAINEYIEWNSVKTIQFHSTSDDKELLPDLFFYLLNPDGDPVCFQRIKSSLFHLNDQIMIIKLFPEPCYGKVTSTINSGLLKAKIILFNNLVEKSKVDMSKFRDGDSGEEQSEEDLEKLNREAIGFMGGKIKDLYTVVCIVYMCRYIISSDSNGNNDPYVRITCVDEKRETSIKHDTINGIWNETLVFNTVQLDLKKKSTWPILLVEVLDYDRVGKDDVLGSSYVWLSDSPYNINNTKVVKPKWHQLYLPKSNKPQGEILLSFYIFDQDNKDLSRKINPVPETESYSFEINILGLRDMKPLSMLPIKKAFIKFDMNSLNISGNEEDNLQPRVTQPKDKGSNPTINSALKFDLNLPKDDIFMPQLQCEVYDYIFSGIINPTLGIFLINIRKLIMETNRQIEEDEKITRVKLGYYIAKGVVSNSPGGLGDLDK